MLITPWTVFVATSTEYMPRESFRSKYKIRLFPRKNKPTNPYLHIPPALHIPENTVTIARRYRLLTCFNRAHAA